MSLCPRCKKRPTDEAYPCVLCTGSLCEECWDTKGWCGTIEERKIAERNGMRLQSNGGWSRDGGPTALAAVHEELDPGGETLWAGPDPEAN